MVWLAYWVVMGTIFGSSLFALWKGDQPLRYAAILRFTVLLPGLGVQYALGKSHIPMSVWLPIFELSATAILASGFLFLAVRYGSPWLAGAMMIQGCDFYYDRVFLDADIQNRASYGILENLITTGVALTLALGTIAAIHQRQRLRKDQAARAQKAAERQARIDALLAGRLGELA
jgi:hypothetical protein